MTEIDKKIQEVKNQRQNVKNDIAEKMTILRIREAELRAIESFVDQLNDLKEKTKQVYYLQHRITVTNKIQNNTYKYINNHSKQNTNDRRELRDTFRQ